MTHRPLSTPSGLRVFSASLLSALLIMMPFVQMAAASRRSEVRDQKSERGTSPTPREDSNAAAENVFLNAPVPKPAPEPPALGPTIVATKDDGLAAATTVAPGGTITYTVNIQNNGAASPADDATNVQFSDTIDAHTTLVAGSRVAAVSDKYNTIGNTQISVADGSTDLLGNDFDPDTGNNVGMTVTGYGATTGTEQTAMGTATATAQGGSVTVQGNGSFTYDPPLGFEGTDTFKYRADSGGFTAITTVTITIAGMIWFVNNNAGACTSSCDGRLSHPFQTLAAFQAVNNGAGSNPAAGDSIFLYESATAYGGPVTLLNNQKFIGQDATASLASITGITAPSGTDPFPVMNTGGNATTITATGANNAINLGQGNTLRGFTGGNTATGAKISGNNFGTLIVGNSASPDVTLNGTGQALTLTTGTLSVTGGFVSVATTSSAGPGISLAGVADSDGAGGLSFSFGSTTVSGSTTQGILVGTTTADLNFGTTTVGTASAGSGGTDAVSLSSNSSGTRTFGALTIQNSTGNGFRHASGGGAVNVTGATAITNPGTIGINVDASTTLVSFGNANVTQSGGAGVSFTNNADVNGDLTFADLDIAPDANVPALVATTNTGTLTSTTGDIITTDANAINSTSSVLALALNSVTAANSGSAASGISLTSTTGTFSSSAGTITGGTNPAVLVNAGSVQVTYGGGITQADNAALLSVSNANTSAINFNGNLSATNGTGLQFSNADGTYNFNATTTLNGGDAGVDILLGSGGTFAFSGTTITNPTGIAFNVDGTTTANTGGISISGTISKNNDGKLIDFFNYDTGTATISGTLSCTSTCDGVEVTNDGTSSGTVNASGGTKTLNTSGSVAVNLDNNDGGNVNFSGGGLDIDTTSGTGFNAINGGTVTVTTGANPNTIDSTTGTALNVAGTTIGASGLTFRSISSNGASSGIVLNATGASGSLVVAGNGGSCTSVGTCTGGAIQNSTGDGISLTTTLSPSFTRMAIQTTVGHGVKGTDVTNFTFQNGFIDNSGTGLAAGASNIAFSTLGNNNIDGVVSIINNTLTNAYFHGVFIENDSGTITSLDISNNTFTSSTAGGPAVACPASAPARNPTTCSQGNGIHVIVRGNASVTSNLNDATVTNNIISNFPLGGGIIMQGSNAAVGSPQLTFGIPSDANNIISITGNRIAGASNTNRINTNAIQVGINGIARGNWEINNNGTIANPITNIAGNVISTSVLGTSTGTVTINNNRIVANHTPNFGAPFGISAGVGRTFACCTDVAVLTIVIDGNNVSGTDGNGIKIRGAEAQGTMNVRISNNTVAAPVATALREGIFVEAGGSTAGTDNDVCLDIVGNTTSGATDGFDTAPGIRLRKQGTSTTVNAFSIEGMAATGTPGVEQYVGNFAGGKNPGSANGTYGVNGVVLGSATTGFTNCSAAPLLLALGGVESLTDLMSIPVRFAHADRSFDDSQNFITGAPIAPLSLTQPQLDSIVAAAINRWSATGLTANQIAAMRELRFEVGDLANSYLGKARGNSIVVDRDAQGKGWFVDPTPLADSEFGEVVSTTRRYTNPFTSAAGRIDLLTAIEHEIGHKLGLTDSYAEKDRDNLMYGHLTVGERRAPAKGQAANAQAGSLAGTHFLKLNKPEVRGQSSEVRKQKAVSRKNHAATTRALAPMSGETVTANIGTLPAGGSVTITFQVTVNNPPNLTLLNAPGPRVENQGTVSGGNFANVFTDDPNVGGAADKTATRIDLFDTTTSLVSDLNPSNDGDQVTFTATVNETPAQTPNPTGTVDFIDTSNGNAVICNDVAVSAGSAQCQVSNLSAGSTHNIRADYSGDGNFDSSQSNIVAQVVNACVNNPVVTNTSDSGAGSLRDALASVCSAPNNNITFNIPIADPGFSGGVYTITLVTELVVAKTVNITGPNSVTNTNPIVVSGNNASRVLNINAAKTATIGNLTITNGAANGGSLPSNAGGAIYNQGTITLLNTTVKDSTSSGFGGGIFNHGGTLTITNSTVSGNSSNLAGGLYNFSAGTLNVVNSTISSNIATAHGGGIYNDGSTLNMTNSTVSGNTAGGLGGGIFNSGVATFTNVTVTNNTADSDNNSSGTGGGISQNAGTVTLHNTIVAGNFNEDGVTDARDDVNGALDAASTNNLIGDGTGMTGITHGTNGNQVGTGVTPIDAMLGALANNGGPTFTHALSPTSPAVEAGSNTAATSAGLTTDQRGTGFPRIADSADANTTQTVDIGAFELHPSIEDITDKTTAEDTAVPQITFNLGDGTGALISTVTATSGNTTLVPNANLVVGGSGSTRTLDITPAANANSPADGTATITVTVTATNGRTAVDTFVVTVTEVNDAPVPTSDAVSDIQEDCASGCTSGKYVIPFATLLGNDTNKGAANESGQTVNITNVSAPTGGTVVINGTDIEFTPTANFFGAAGFTYTVTDNGTTNTVLDAKTGNTTVSFNVTAVNDPPSFTIAADPTAVNEDAAAQTVNSFATAISQGPGGETGQTPLTFNLTPTGSTGTLTFSSGPAIDSTTGNLTYTPTANTNGTATFSVTLSDSGSNVSPNSNTSGAQSFTITVNAQNDAPVVTTTVANLSYTEGDPATAIDTGLTVTDVDSANLTGATVSITSNFQSGADVLSWTDNNAGDNITLSGTSTAQTIVLTGSDTPANYQLALRAVSYQNTSNDPSTATRTVTFTADDGTNTGSNTRGIAVTAVNDGPVNTVPGAQGTAVNTALVFSSGNSNQISVADVDAGSNAIKVTLTATNGTLTLNGTTGLDFTGTCSGAAGDGTADTTMTFCGALTDISNALNGMSFNPTSGYSGAASVSITSNDQGNTGTGGALQDGPDTVNITVSSNVSVNDASVAEPASPNTVDMTFTVALNAPAPAGGVSVNFTTQDEPAGPGKAVAGTCGAGGDYTLTSGTVSFTAGQQVKTINVPVCSDGVSEPDETFLVVLSSPSGATIVDGTATGTIKSTNTAGTVLISELRTSGPGGAGDDFVEIYNNTNSPLTVAASDASAGYGLYKMGADCNATPILIGVIPNGTVIPARGHYLFVGSGYTLANYGGTAAAAGNLTFSSDIETDANVGLFSTSNVTGISSVNRLDAVGFGVNTGGACDLLREASTLPPIAGNATIEHSYFRKMCDWLQGQGCTVPGVPKDTNNNLADFWLADTTGAAITGRLGAPGPENLASPIRRDNAGINMVVLDGTVGSAAGPNRDRNGGDPAGLFGSMTLRYRVTNNTGANVTRLRYRIVDMSTAIQPAGPTADLRALTGVDTSVNPVGDAVTCASQGAGAPPCTVTVRGTTLETPPAQAIGGGYNSTLSSGTITTGTPLAPGASIPISFKLGVQKTGTFRVYVVIEALP